MRRKAKIVLGIVILLACVLSLSALQPSTTPPAKDEVTNENDTLPYSPFFAKGTTNENVRIGNWSTIVSNPTYSKTFCEECNLRYMENIYRVFTARKGYRFALIKINVTNYGKEEGSPYFHDVILTTSKDLKYKEGAGYNYTEEYYKTQPTLLFERIIPCPDVLPRDNEEGYFHFEIPQKAKLNTLHFNYTIPPEDNIEREIIIEL